METTVAIMAILMSVGLYDLQRRVNRLEREIEYLERRVKRLEKR